MGIVRQGFGNCLGTCLGSVEKLFGNCLFCKVLAIICLGVIYELCGKGLPNICVGCAKYLVNGLRRVWQLFVGFYNGLVIVW